MSQEIKLLARITTVILIGTVLAGILVLVSGHHTLFEIYAAKSPPVPHSWTLMTTQADIVMYHVHKMEAFLLKIGLTVFFCCMFIYFAAALAAQKYRTALSISVLLLLFGSVLSFTIFDRSVFHFWGFDDAYISYRYALNLVQGHGLVYNIGERVEGYSNFLYTILMAGGIALLGKNAAYFFSLTVNVSSGLIALLVFYKFVQSKLGKPHALFAVFLFSICVPLWHSIASGIETPVVLLVILALWAVLERVTDHDDAQSVPLSTQAALYLLITIPIVLRADGFIISLSALFYLFLHRKTRIALTASGLACAVLICYFLWRFHFYGYWLPNTYYVKVDGPLLSRISYAVTALFTLSIKTGLWIYLLAILYSALNRIWERCRLGFFHLLSMILVLYWFYIGGDHFNERFLLPLFPMGIYALLQIFDTQLPRKVLALLITLFIGFHATFIIDGLKEAYHPATRYDPWIAAGQFLNKNYPGKSIAIDAAGKIPYFSELKTIDMLGLNDLVIGHKKLNYYVIPGHNKFDPDYALSRKPDLMASFVVNSKLDLSFSMDRQRYEQAGYKIAYLVYGGRYAQGLPKIIDVSKSNNERIWHLAGEGYRYAILERTNA